MESRPQPDYIESIIANLRINDQALPQSEIRKLTEKLDEKVREMTRLSEDVEDKIRAMRIENAALTPRIHKAMESREDELANALLSEQVSLDIAEYAQESERKQLAERIALRTTQIETLSAWLD